MNAGWSMNSKCRFALSTPQPSILVRSKEHVSHTSTADCFRRWQGSMIKLSRKCRKSSLTQTQILLLLNAGNQCCTISPLWRGRPSARANGQHPIWADPNDAYANTADRPDCPAHHPHSSAEASRGTAGKPINRWFFVWKGPWFGGVDWGVSTQHWRDGEL